MRREKAIGDAGEAAAVVFLEAQGFRIVDTNVRFGAKISDKENRLRGELDIVAWEDNALCFVEVKTRTTTPENADESPAEAVSNRKQAQIVRLALAYAAQGGLLSEDGAVPLRFDVVAVRRVWKRGREDFSCELIRSAFYPPEGD